MRARILILFGVLFSTPLFAEPKWLSSDELTVSDYRGQWVYLDFWATWCAPCKASFPWMNAMQERYGDRGFQVVAVSVDSSQKQAEKFLKRQDAEFDAIYDPKGELATRYSVQAMPSSFLLNPAGEVVLQHQGFVKRDKPLLESAIRKHLGIATP